MYLCAGRQTHARHNTHELRAHVMMMRMCSVHVVHSLYRSIGAACLSVDLCEEELHTPRYEATLALLLQWNTLIHACNPHAHTHAHECTRV